MNVRDMSDAALSRWIANKLEPAPKRSDAVPLHGTDPLWSMGNCWIWSAFYKDENGELLVVSGTLTPRFDWRPRNMVSDPAMTLMLLEKRCFYSIRKHPRGWVFTDEKGVDHKHVNNLSVMSLGRAVVEDFALANGIEEAASGS